MKYQFSDDGAYIRVYDAESGAQVAIVRQHRSPTLHEAIGELLVNDANDCGPDDPALADIVGLKLDIAIGLHHFMQAGGISKAHAGELIGCSGPVLDVILRGDSSMRNLLRACAALGAKVTATIGPRAA